MRYQDQLVKLTQKALDDVVRAAEATVICKLDWKPAPTARSVIDQMRELASSADWLLPILVDGAPPAEANHAEEQAAHVGSIEDGLTSSIRELRTSTTRFCRAISELPDERLEQEVRMPFGPGTVMTVADVAYLHAWNLTYHLGQINYVQTLYGDAEMH